MTLDFEVNRHFTPEKYKQLFNEFENREPILYNILNSEIHDYCKGKVELKYIKKQILGMELEPDLNQAYFNVLNSVGACYGTNRSN